MCEPVFLYDLRDGRAIFRPRNDTRELGITQRDWDANGKPFELLLCRERGGVELSVVVREDRRRRG